MNKAEIIVARLLEADPDEFDPKSEFLKAEPETVYWLERNGFTSNLKDGWWHKEVNGDHFNARWPMWGEAESGNNGWTLTSLRHGKPFFNLSSRELKNFLISWGAATE